MNAISFKQLKDPVVLIAVGFGSGLAPKAPGTAGTLIAVPLFMFMQPLPLISYLKSLRRMLPAGTPPANSVGRSSRDLAYMCSLYSIIRNRKNSLWKMILTVSKSWRVRKRPVE